jgi:hypothetical protein
MCNTFRNYLLSTVSWTALSAAGVSRYRFGWKHTDAS